MKLRDNLNISFPVMKLKLRDEASGIPPDLQDFCNKSVIYAISRSLGCLSGGFPVVSVHIQRRSD
jgi:hypothetical protein